MLTFRALGWREAAPPEGHVARISAEYAGGYLLLRPEGELRAVVNGKLRRAAKLEATARPTVGDWVRFSGTSEALGVAIVELLPRRTLLVRRAAGSDTVGQVIAANVDTLMIVNALDVQVNVRRIERFATIARDGGSSPVVLLSKSDLPHDEDALRARLAEHLPNVPVHFVSARDEQTLAPLECYFGEGFTVAVVGLSGAGKSTLINLWVTDRSLATGDVGAEGKGRHTTTSRTLHVRARGGLILDTPGVREVGVLADEEQVASQFEDIEALAKRCRFGNCRHAREPGCAIGAALATGDLREDRWASFQRLTNEARGQGATRKRAPKRH